MSNWTGTPTTLQTAQSVSIPQTSMGTMTLVYYTTDTGNETGEIQLASGGARPISLPVRAGANQPCVYVKNWQASNLKITNTSLNEGFGIDIALYGPGFFPMNCLPIGHDALPLSTLSCAYANAEPQYMTLRMSAQSGQQTSFLVIGGPYTHGINGYTFGLNFPTATGPEKLPGEQTYYQTTSGNSIEFPFNWGSSRLWVANISGATAAPGSVLLF